VAAEGTDLISSKRATVSRGPWLTAVFIGLACGLGLWPASHHLAIYAREEIMHGAFWRLFTGHLVHFGGGHLAWNLAVVLVAGVWLERSHPVSTRWFMLTSPVVLGLALLWLEPRLEFYGGLSGIATGLITLLGLHGLRGTSRDRWCGVALLVFVGLKTAGEWTDRVPTLVRFSQDDIIAVPLVHLTGMIYAVVYFVAQASLQRNPPGVSAPLSGP
jgi:rhomboid family GlyGly-CTERM serine protease